MKKGGDSFHQAWVEAPTLIPECEARVSDCRDLGEKGFQSKVASNLIVFPKQKLVPRDSPQIRETTVRNILQSWPETGVLAGAFLMLVWVGFLVLIGGMGVWALVSIAFR